MNKINDLIGRTGLGVSQAKKKEKKEKLFSKEGKFKSFKRFIDKFSKRRVKLKLNYHLGIYGQLFCV